MNILKPPPRPPTIESRAFLLLLACNLAQAQAFEAARKHSGQILVEKHVEGRDYRLVGFNGELIWAIERVPGGVMGDGQHTVAQLLQRRNADPRRGSGQYSPLKTLTLDETSPGIYTYDNPSFFLLDGEGFGNEGNAHNYHFTAEFDGMFTYRPGQTFYFRGDDDLWVYINDSLVIDLGGVHGPAEAFVDLDLLGLTVDNTYSFDLFYAERL